MGGVTEVPLSVIGHSLDNDSSVLVRVTLGEVDWCLGAYRRTKASIDW